ncbi:uncharacterized protein T551_01183 [Pneumocystis jirovecii RU7]|uniref:Uncharacterized protein n=1 Tax=Pneumocystis jirovecii (strain RU7) TaxID=1408657 RepID=A0A0W4ZU75_PNEJ7|nr:uncharacterized protein T551_01183 [Pneumocystis jirovecii RU7]KTW31922.1 hypothetical protein T551_01183 [Pneumocystis jirovecii RU7]
MDFPVILQLTSLIIILTIVKCLKKCFSLNYICLQAEKKCDNISIQKDIFNTLVSTLSEELYTFNKHKKSLTKNCENYTRVISNKVCSSINNVYKKLKQYLRKICEFSLTLFKFLFTNFNSTFEGQKLLLCSFIKFYNTIGTRISYGCYESTLKCGILELLIFLTPLPPPLPPPAPEPELEP